MLSINEISASISKAITLLKMNKKYCSIIQIYILSVSMYIQNLNGIHKLIHKILSINKILMLIKGHNSVKNWLKIACIINKMLSKLIHLFWRYWGKNTFLHRTRVITLLFINEFSPFTIPNHPSLISMSMQSLKTIRQKLLKLRVWKCADGCTFSVAGYKNQISLNICTVF